MTTNDVLKMPRIATSRKKLYGAYLRGFGMAGRWFNTELLVAVSHSERALMRRYHHHSSLVIRPVSLLVNTRKWGAYPK